MVGTVERAFQLARERKLRTVEQIRIQLAKEGCPAVDDHLAGLSTKRQLSALIRGARPN
jgi:hypothetical protein